VHFAYNTLAETAAAHHEYKRSTIGCRTLRPSGSQSCKRSKQQGSKKCCHPCPAGEHACNSSSSSSIALTACHFAHCACADAAVYNCILHKTLHCGWRLMLATTDLCHACVCACCATLYVDMSEAGSCCCNRCMHETQHCGQRLMLVLLLLVSVRAVPRCALICQRRASCSSTMHETQHIGW
jgi:hypothetical protein